MHGHNIETVSGVRGGPAEPRCKTNFVHSDAMQEAAGVKIQEILQYIVVYATFKPDQSWGHVPLLPPSSRAARASGRVEIGYLQMFYELVYVL